MYLHLGNEEIIKTENIIGIFDMDNTTVSKRTRNYLFVAEKKGEVVTISSDLPKSFVVCAEKGKKNQTVYISQISASTLLRRAELNIITV